MPARVRLALVVAGVCSLGLTAGVLLAVRAGSGASAHAAGFAGALRPAGTPAVQFTLRDQDGRPSSVQAYRGQPVIAAFLYSTCRDSCPIIAQQIRGALDQLSHDVPALAVSVDPRHDTRESARAFLARQHIAGRVRFLLGSSAELRPIWRAFGIAPQGPGRGLGYDHSAYVILLDGHGYQRIGFPLDHLTPEGLAHDVRRLQSEMRAGSPS